MSSGVTLFGMIALFLPIFLALELVSAAPGRRDLGVVVRHGVRNFGRHLVILVVSVAALHFFVELMITIPPLW
jgi:hypothetical protein